MAAGNMTVKVSVENIIHHAMRQVFEQLAKDHGVFVEGVEISWLDVSTHAKKEKIITDVKVTSVTMQP